MTKKLSDRLIVTGDGALAHTVVESLEAGFIDSRLQTYACMSQALSLRESTNKNSSQDKEIEAQISGTLSELVRDTETLIFVLRQKSDLDRVKKLLEAAQNADQLSASGGLLCLTVFSGRIRNVQSYLHLPLEWGADEALVWTPAVATCLPIIVRTLVRKKLSLEEWSRRKDTALAMGASRLNFRERRKSVRLLMTGGSEIESSGLRTDLEGRGLSLQCIEQLIAKPNIKRDSVLGDGLSYDLSLFDLTGAATRAHRVLSVLSRLKSDPQTRRKPALIIAPRSRTGGTLARMALEMGADGLIFGPLTCNYAQIQIDRHLRTRRQLDHLLSTWEEALNLAVTDSVTGVYTRRYALRHLEHSLRHSVETGRPLSVLLVDIDHFKRINDTNGHLVGDDVLRALAERMASNLRDSDLIGRYGGEEFLVVMPDTPQDVAAIVARRLKELVAAQPFVSAHVTHRVTATVSIGVASSILGTQAALLGIDMLQKALAAETNGTTGETSSHSPDAPQTQATLEDGAKNGRSVVTEAKVPLGSASDRFMNGLLNNADQALYRAKALGRDRVVTSERTLLDLHAAE